MPLELRWSPTLTRKGRIAEEKRACYQQFLEAAENYFASLRAAAFDEGKLLAETEFSSLEAAKTNLSFRCGEIGVRSCAELAGHLRDYRRAIKNCRKADAKNASERHAERDCAYRKVAESRLSAIIAGRNDAEIDGKSAALERTIRSLFLMVKEPELDQVSRGDRY